MKNNILYVIGAIWILSICSNGAWLYITAFALLLAFSGDGVKRRKKPIRQKKIQKRHV